MNAWLKRWKSSKDKCEKVFWHLSKDKCEKVLPPLVDFAILGTTKSPEFCDPKERVGL